MLIITHCSACMHGYFIFYIGEKSYTKVNISQMDTKSGESIASGVTSTVRYVRSYDQCPDDRFDFL